MAAKQIMTETRIEQVDHWMKYGIHKQIQQQQLQLLVKKESEDDDDNEDDDDEPAKKIRKGLLKAVDVRDQKPCVTVLLSPANMKKITSLTTLGTIKPSEVVSRRKSSIPKFQIPNEPNGSLKRRLTQLKGLLSIILILRHRIDIVFDKNYNIFLLI